MAGERRHTLPVVVADTRPCSLLATRLDCGVKTGCSTKRKGSCLGGEWVVPGGGLVAPFLVFWHCRAARYVVGAAQLLNLMEQVTAVVMVSGCAAFEICNCGFLVPAKAVPARLSNSSISRKASAGCKAAVGRR